MSQLKASLASFRRLTSIEDVVLSPKDMDNLRWLDRQIKNMTPGALDVAIERSRQITEKGYDQTHDDAHKDGQLTDAAKCYIAVAVAQQREKENRGINLSELAGWPFEEPLKQKPTPRENLKIAAALLIAEYDRLGRLDATGE